MLNSPAPELISTTCAYCGVGCGIDVNITSKVPVSLSGTKEHPANFGRLCVKGTHLLDTLREGHDSERLSTPQINNQPATWEAATHAVAQKLTETIAQYGPESVALYVSGQLLTEDYYIANKLMKGYLGSANIDTNSRLCMSSAVSAYKRAFGEDVVPCDYQDLELTDLLVLVGSNAAWTHPVLFQRIERAKKQRPNLKIVVIDPRKTASAANSDLHLGIKPGTDAAVFCGLLNYLSENDQLDLDFISRHTDGIEKALSEAHQWSTKLTADFCDVDEGALTTFYQWFAEQKKVITFYSMGINQSSSGVDKCNSIINCHLATGRILKPGAGPFSITGQPNAMGGREVGGLSNQLTAHMDLENPEHQMRVQEFWGSPTIAYSPGKSAVDMFDAVEQGHIKVLWIMATNPLVSLPNSARIEAALKRCECVIVSDCVSKNDTLAYADIVLPATGWSEKDGTVTNSERRISRQRALVSPYGQAKHDWQIMCDVAKKMHFNGFDFEHQSEIFDEWTKLTALTQQLQLDLSSLSGMTQTEYNSMLPVQWPFNDAGESVRPFANNRFSTPNGKARILPIHPKLPVHSTCKTYPLTLNSGRLRDQWHTMTRTGRAPRLSQHSPFQTVMLHPETARRIDIQEGDIVEVKSQFGMANAYANVTEFVRKDDCFMPIHFNRQISSQGAVSELYSSVVDPFSAQPESKQIPVSIQKCEFDHYVSIFTQSQLQLSSPFWVKARRNNCLHYEIAINDEAFLLSTWSQSIVRQTELGKGEWVTAMNNDVQVSLFLTNKTIKWASFKFSHRKAQQEFAVDWVDSLFNERLDFSELTALLRVKPSDAFLKGRLICSCHNVHQKDIEAAIETGADTVQKLGQHLKCGTNCGSCKSELQQMLNVSTESIPVKRVS